MRAPAGDDAISTVPTPGDRIGAFSIVVLALACALLTKPIAHVSAGPNPAFIALIFTSVMPAAFFVAGMLATLYRVSARQPLAILGIAYGFAAVIMSLYMLALPGIFVPMGDLANSVSAEWLWICAHAGFIALAIVYGCAEWLSNDPARESAVTRSRLNWLIAWSSLALAAALVAILWEGRRLPALVSGNAFTPLMTHGAALALLGGYGLAIVAVAALTRFHTTMQLWVTVVLVGLGCDVYVAGVLADARYSVAWYAGSFEGIIAGGAFFNMVARQVGSMLASFADSNRQLADRSVRDALTLLFNRRGFDDRMAALARAPRRRRLSTLCLAIVDVDHFKSINDTFGHTAGDEVLRKVARAIEDACARSGDTCYRIGGEEFAIVLPATDRLGAAVVAERIRANVAALRIPSGTAASRPHVTVSIGVAEADATVALDTETLYREADEALFAAKRGGRDRVVAHADAAALAAPG